MKSALIILIATLTLAIIVGIFGLVLGGKSFVAGADAGILVSHDGGINWNLVDGSKKFAIETMEADREDRLLVGTRSRGLWIFHPKDSRWQNAGSAYLGSARVLDIEPISGSGEFLASVFADQRGRVYRMSGIAEREIYFTPLPQYAVFGVAADALQSSRLHIASSDGGFYESLDAGASWNIVYRFKEGLLHLVKHPASSDQFWVVTSKGRIYRTVDGGKSWKDLSAGLKKFAGSDNVGSFVLDYKAGILYLGSKHGVLRSYNGGDSWEEIPIALPPEALPVTAMAVNPNNSDKILAAVRNELYISQDGGTNWQGIILPTTRTVSSIVIDPTNGNNIYIGLKQ